LQENGDEARAEFIRIQCALEHVHPRWEDLASEREMFPTRDPRPVHELPLPERLADPDRWLLSDDQLKAAIRQRELRIANYDRWSAPFPDWTRRATGTFRRGFMCFFFPTAKQWLQDGERIQRVTPVEELRITRTAGLETKLFQSPTVLGLRRL